MSMDRIYGHDVVPRRQSESSAPLDEHRVVLGMTIGYSQQPEVHLCCHEGFTIRGSLLRTEQDAHDCFNLRATVRLVSARRGSTRKLTDVFLRKPQNALTVVGSHVHSHLYSGFSEKRDTFFCASPGIRFWQCFQAQIACVG